MKREDGSGGSVCAHMRLDPLSGRSVAVQLSPPGIQGTNSDGSPLWRLPCVRFFELDPSGSVACESQHYVAGLNYVHDLSVTPSFYIVHMSPFTEISNEGIDSILTGKLAPGESMKYSPGAPCRLLLFRRPLPGDETQRLPPPMHFDLPAAVHIYHFSRAIEHVTMLLPGADSETVNGVFVPQHYMERKVDDCVVSSSFDSKSPTGLRCIAIEVEACVLGRGFTMDARDGLFLSNASEAPGVMARIICRMGCTAATMQQIDSCSCEFPTIDPRRAVSSVVHYCNNADSILSVFDRVATAPGVASFAPDTASPQLVPPRYTYLMANDRGSAQPFCDIVKLDACGTGRQVWRSEGVVGEPCFVPRPGQLMEDDGWVIVQVQLLMQENNVAGKDVPAGTSCRIRATTEYAVLDARDISKGPIAVVAAGILIPTGFHGTNLLPCVYTVYILFPFLKLVDFLSSRAFYAVSVFLVVSLTFSYPLQAPSLLSCVEPRTCLSSRNCNGMCSTVFGSLRNHYSFGGS